MKRHTLHTRTLTAFALAAGTLAIPLAEARVAAEQAAQLGTTLTPLGATRAGNADGSIPAWTGTLYGLPKGLQWAGPGNPYPDPYGNEKPLFVITAQSAAKYADHLTDGQRALFKAYPDTFRMPVYPSHRDARFPDIYYQRVARNAVEAELVNDDEGIKGYHGALAFPIPQSGAEVIWSARTAEPVHVYEGVYNDTTVYPNGTSANRRSSLYLLNPYADPRVPVSVEYPELGNYQGYVMTEVFEPTRDKGMITSILEPIDYSAYAREVWRYLPGSRRVRRAPTVGYDTPDGPGGLVTIDEVQGFNGAMDRFSWKLLGKQEIYIPYHAYRFDDPAVSYKELLTPYHVNPDYMRYELHRVWAVEATLRPGKRHIYGKRRIYVDEDSGQVVVTENYDGRGELWKVVLLNTFYEYHSRYTVRRAEVYHDLRAAAYIAMRLVNDGKPFTYNVAKPRDADYFGPANIRKLGRR